MRPGGGGSSVRREGRPRHSLPADAVTARTLASAEKGSGLATRARVCLPAKDEQALQGAAASAGCVQQLRVGTQLASVQAQPAQALRRGE